MTHRSAARWFLSGVSGLFAVLLVSPMLLAGDVSTGDVTAETFTPTETAIPVTETAVPATDIPDQPGSGGIVVATAEPTATEIDRGGLAPGQVVLVIATSDGGMIPAGTTACIGDVCQTLGSDTPSRFKWQFERMKEGWQEIRIRAAGPYEGTISGVRVVPGGMVTANVEIVRIAPRADEGSGGLPPPAQDSPAATTISVVDVETDDVSTDSTQRFAQVTNLPETGAGTSSPALALGVLIGASGLMFAVALVVQRRTTAR